MRSPSFARPAGRTSRHGLEARPRLRNAPAPRPLRANDDCLHRRVRYNSLSTTHPFVRTGVGGSSTFLSLPVYPTKVKTQRSTRHVLGAVAWLALVASSDTLGPGVEGADGGGAPRIMGKHRWWESYGESSGSIHYRIFTSSDARREFLPPAGQARVGQGVGSVRIHRPLRLASWSSCWLGWGRWAAANCRAGGWTREASRTSDAGEEQRRKEERKWRKGEFEREGGFILLAICKSMD